MRELSTGIVIVAMTLLMGGAIASAQEMGQAPGTPPVEVKPDTMQPGDTTMPEQPADVEVPEKPMMPEPTLAVDSIACGIAVTDRELEGQSQTFPDTVQKVFCWTYVTATRVPATIEHVWYHGDEEVARVPLEIKYIRTRTWSSKTIPPEWIGNWKVEVVDLKGNVLATAPFTVE
jgi:hypothetical protein